MDGNTKSNTEMKGCSTKQIRPNNLSSALEVSYNNLCLSKRLNVGLESLIERLTGEAKPLCEEDGESPKGSLPELNFMQSRMFDELSELDDKLAYLTRLLVSGE